MRTFAVLFGMIAISFSSSFANGETRNELMSCYGSAGTLEDKYSCFGSTVGSCSEGSDLGIEECAIAETRVWREIMDQEIAQITSTLKERAIISGPCKGNQEGCLQGLNNLIADDAKFAEQQCEKEALPENNAGAPAMAAALCELREAARTTVRVRKFGQEMGETAAE